MNDVIIDVRQLSVSRGGRRDVLSIDRFTARRGELIAVVGPNGAGKSTLLQAINLLQGSEGEISLFGETVTAGNKTGLRRRSAMVLQDMLLLKDSVFNNVALALKFRGLPEKETAARVQQVLEDFQCSHLASRPALLLSGGESQRVCIARAMVSQPELLLLDEPFAALDVAAREELMEEIRTLAKARQTTVLLVSHNFSDVLHFAERAVILFDGRIVQDAAPEEIMRHPLNEQVARLVGMDNIIPCQLENEGKERLARLANGLCFVYAGPAGGSISACCIPGDAIGLAAAGTGQAEGIVERVVPGIGIWRLLVKCGESVISVRIPRSALASPPAAGSKISLSFKAEEVHFI